MQAARWVFLIAGVYGLLVLIPGLFVELLAAPGSTPIPNPEYYYGFLGITLAWQVAFLVIALDPQRFRPLMPVAVLEKASFVAVALALYPAGRMAMGPTLYGAMIDAVLMLAFLWAWRATGRG